MNGKDLLQPSTRMLVVLIAISIVIMTVMFPLKNTNSIVEIVAYIVPFYTLVASCVHIYDALQNRIDDIRDRILNIPIVDRICCIPLVERYRADVIFKSQVRLYFSIAINLGYIALNVVTFYLYHSSWFLVIAAYYTILFGLCMTLLRFHKKVGFGISRIDDLRITRNCAFVLLTLNLILLIAVEMIIYQDAGYHYKGIVIYFMAIYTFFTSCLAVVNLIRFSKYGNSVVTIIRVAVVAAALVSILTLETALLFQYGSYVEKNVKEMIVVLTGIGIGTIIIGMAMRLISQTSDEIRAIRAEGSDNITTQER